MASEPGYPGFSEDESAINSLVPVVYDELKRIAASMLLAGRPLSLQPTGLVHEAFLKLAAERGKWTDENHFRAVASIAMRRVLSDHLRARSRAKRGGGRRRVTLNAHLIGDTPVELSVLDAALTELEAASPRVAQLVIYRFFGDMSVEHAAERLGISRSTAEADWRFARAWLQRRLAEEAA